MHNDLQGLARHVGHLLAVCGIFTLVVGLVVFLVSHNGLPADRHEDAVIILGVLGVTELLAWFGLVFWADTARDRPPS